MVDVGIKTLKERGSSSLTAIKKYLTSTYKVDAQELAPFIKKYLKSAVTSEKLIQTKGNCASGSFKLSAATSKEQTAEEKKATADKKENVASAAKKAAPGKNPSAAKKTPANKPKAPKDKSAAAANPKKAAPAKKPAVKKDAAKK